MESYNSTQGARQYIDFINSASGKFEQEILPPFIFAALGPNCGRAVLDAGCGTGWLTAVLAEKFAGAAGCDASLELINYAKKTYPRLNFTVCDVTRPLPFLAGQFDAVVANMSMHDMADVPGALANFFAALKPDGKLILTVANPYYSLPVGVWKRGLRGKLLLQKPRLLLRPYFFFKRQIQRRFLWGKNISSHFYTLPEYINWALAAGFHLLSMADVEAKKDSPKFGLQYQLYRFPYILVLEFGKGKK